jgi:hypothetical protein
VDIQLYLRVLWRFRVIVCAGLFLAVLLAVLAYGRVTLADGRPTLEPRGTETWQAMSVILITQDGFPWGRAVPQYTEPDPDAGVPAIPLGDQDRFSALSQIYSQLANSDTVRASLLRSARIPGTVEAAPSVDGSGAPQPLMTITATSNTAGNAARLAKGATEAFQRYVIREQTQADIATGDRIQLQVLASGEKPQLIAPRKKTLPGLVFFAIMAATIGLVFVLENFRPNARPSPKGERLAAVPSEPGTARKPARPRELSRSRTSA